MSPFLMIRCCARLVIYISSYYSLSCKASVGPYNIFMLKLEKEYFFREIDDGADATIQEEAKDMMTPSFQSSSNVQPCSTPVNFKNPLCPIRDGRTIEMLYSDGSFSDKSGIGGMAVIAPEWTAIYSGDKWYSTWDIFIGREPEYGAVAFCASCSCKDANYAEKFALNIAFRLAYDMISIADEEQDGEMNVEIVTDSTFNIDCVTRWNTIGDPILNSIYGLWIERRIILNSVKAHDGNFGNELADKWAGKVRLIGESHLTPRASQPQRGTLSKSQIRKRRNRRNGPTPLD